MTLPVEDTALLTGSLVKFLLATLLSGAIGLERERKGRAAGLRTHVLVCLGSTLAVVVSDLIAAEWAATHSSVFLDRGRIAAGILTGVGFLGAGTIINVGGSQRGLTTAAMIWFVAALGIAVGVGLYGVALLATLLALLLVIGLEFVEGKLPSSEHYMIVLDVPRGLDLMEEVAESMRHQGYAVHPVQLRVSEEGGEVEMAFDIASKTRPHLEMLIKTLLAKFPMIRQIECRR